MEKRIHFLDQMRSHMMLLGVVLHVSGSYTTLPAGELWPYKDLSTHGIFTVLAIFIHSFRMQVFFLVAGFFAAMLIGKNGNGAFLKNRSQRILLPFLLFLLPICVSCFVLFRHGVYLMASRGIAVNMPTVWSLYHLWFLYYLYLYCLLAVPLCRVLRGVFSNPRQDVRIVSLLPWALAVALAVIYLMAENYVLETPVGFNLIWSVFIQYGLFFATGVIGYQCKDTFFTGFASWWRWLLIALVALILFVATAIHTAQTQPDNPQAVRWYGAMLLGVYTVALCWMLVALYQHYLNRFSRVGRYLSESSYWIYLVHLPMAIAIPMLMDQWPLTGWLKFMVALVAVFAIGVVTYHLLVRSTVLGVLLNGRRRPLLARLQ